MAHRPGKARSKAPASSAPTQRRDKPLRPKEVPEERGKNFDWKFGDQLSASEFSDGGQYLYNRTYLSKVITSTPFGHWMGYRGESELDTTESMSYLAAQIQSVPKETANAYLQLPPIPDNLDTREEIKLLVSVKIEALQLNVKLFGEALRGELEDRVNKREIMFFLPRLLWPLVQERHKERFLEIVRIPFYANLYDELDHSHPLIPKAEILDRIRSQAGTSSRMSHMSRLPIEVLREIMCRLSPHELGNFARASKWAYRIATDDDVWCWQCATRLNLQVLPTLMKAICTEYRRLWILLNNRISITFQMAFDERTMYGQPCSHFVVEFKIGALRRVARSPFPNRQFAPERAKE